MGNFLINFKVRAKNKIFWITLIPAVLVAVQLIAGLFGFDLNVSFVSEQLVKIVEAVFGVLAILGVVVDPTTYGIGDSENALTYTSPGVNEDIFDEDDEDKNEDE